MSDTFYILCWLFGSCLLIAAVNVTVQRLARWLWRQILPDVLVQRRLHDTLFTLSLRDHALWIVEGDNADSEQVPFQASGHVWDLGCNIGIYSVQAARAGCRVTAFDISLTNALCLRQTAALNGLSIDVVHSPVTVCPVAWTPAATAHTEEALQKGGERLSCTYLEAAERYGRPDFIKFDIQGGEAEFLMSRPFQDWVREHNIGIYLETHDDTARLVWPDFQQVGPIHFILPITGN